MKEPLEQVKVDARLICPSHWWCYMAGYGSLGGLGAWACSTPTALACSGGWYSGWMPGDFCWRRLGAWPSGLLTSLLAAGMLLAGPVSAQGGPALAFEPGGQVVAAAQVEAAAKALQPSGNGVADGELSVVVALSESNSNDGPRGEADAAAGRALQRGVDLRQAGIQGQDGLTDCGDHAHPDFESVPAVQASRGILTAEPPREPFGEKRMARRRGQQRGHLHVQGKKWYLAYREDVRTDDGEIGRERRNVIVGTRKELSKREARRRADEILASVNTLAVQPWSLVTLEEFINRRFKPDVIWTLKASGKKHYDYILSHHVIPAIGGMAIRDITSDQVQETVRLKIEAGYSVQTAVHIRNAISAVFNHAKLKRYFVGDNPAAGVRMPELVRVREPRALTVEQAKRLIALLESPVREMALVSMTTSLNVSEMVGQRWKYVNLTAETRIVGNEALPPYSLAVREQFYRGSWGTVKTKSRRRTVPLGASVIEALISFRQQQRHIGPEDPVFCSRNGTPLNENNLMKRKLKPVAKQLGLDWVSWHTFRHTHATLGEMIGMALSDRQAQMGHADTRMTMHYTHTDLDRRRTSIERMAGLLVDPPSGVVN